MAFKIPVGPSQLALHQGYAVLVTDRDGQIRAPSNKGFYLLDTRVISGWEIYANGQPWDLLNSASISHFAAQIYLTNRPIATAGGKIAERTLGLTIGRWLAGGLHEDIDVLNFGTKKVRFNLEIAIHSDFADLFEVKREQIIRRGQIATEWRTDLRRLRTSYINEDFCREIAITALDEASDISYANGRINFDIVLAPGDLWHACLLYEPGSGKERFEAPRESLASSMTSKVGQRLCDWREAALDIRTSNRDFQLLFDQSIDDMAALRLPYQQTEGLEFVPAGGVPWFVTLFGRDSLIASLQTSLVSPSLALGTLDALGALQAKERDDDRDAEPGKIMHELRCGELAHFHLVPHTPYYGTADATILYLIVLHVAWCCTGDASLIERHLGTAEACLKWIDEYGDRDGDGFQEYQTRSPDGYENQGWKDSDSAVIYPDGSLVKGPKALCELQGYVYDAWIRMAEIYDFLRLDHQASNLREKARKLFDHFNHAFWDEGSQCYAYALDGKKHKVMTLASNIGHCLWSGIIPAKRAGRVVARLTAPDMSSGWGLRTLSSNNPTYNPHSYQNGSVWPHDNSIIAMGFRRYGFVEEALKVAHDVCDAASYFMLHQVPELYAGIRRDPLGFPVQYLGANVPQAWAAGSTFAFLQAILGFQPDAPHRKLYIDPVLPEWLADLTLTNLQIGGETLDMRFWRDGESTRWEVSKGDPEIVSHRSYTFNRSRQKEEKALSEDIGLPGADA